MKIVLFIIGLFLTLVSTPASATEPFVKVKNGSFCLNDSKWYPFGTMYRPLYAQPGPDRERIDWLEAYAPDVIAEDLDLIRSLGFNAVRVMDSRFFNNKHRSANWVAYPTLSDSYKTRFNDFLDKLGERGMKVQIFLHATPEGSPWIPSVFTFVYDRKVREECLALVQKTVRELGLADRPEVWGYGVDWEPHVGDESTRNSPGAVTLWNRWILDQYGSIENAEKSWGYLGKTVSVGDVTYVTAPIDEEVLNDGEWTKKSVAYRRFLIQLINRKYAYLTRAIRNVDPNHLITAQRCAFIGRIPNHDKRILYPIRHTCAFLDYVGYTFSPHDTWGLYDEKKYREDANLFRKQAFAIRYSKFGLPVIFTEYGGSTWTERRPDLLTEQLELRQKLHYKRMLEVALEFGIDGTLAWWWVGKRPMDKLDTERSDWGIRRMDGSLKPCADVVKQFAPLMRSAPEYKPNFRITFDEFAHANEADMYIRGKEDFLAALEEGKLPEVVSRYEGTDSLNCPLTSLDGSEADYGPLRALDASLGIVEVLNSEEQWVDVQYGDTVKVSSDRANVRLLAGNTGDATWLSAAKHADRTGSVVLVARVNGIEQEQTISGDVPPNGRELIETDLLTGAVTLRMKSANRSDFGEALRFDVRKDTE